MNKKNRDLLIGGFLLMALTLLMVGWKSRQPHSELNIKHTKLEKASSLFAQSLELENWTLNNVKDYGAIGDGITDDTDAIQKCITTAEQNSPRFGYESAYPEIIFPGGTYVVSRPIVISATPEKRGLYLRGLSEVTIKQTDPDSDIFYIHNGFRHVVDNLNFEGGKRHIKFFTGNKDKSTLLVRNCDFHNSSSYAIDDALKGVHYSNIIPPYDVFMQDGLPMLTTNEVDSLPDVFYTSSLLTVTDCRFYNCMNVLRAFADWGILRNCTIETNPDMKGAAIYSRGVLKLENVEGLAHVTSGNAQRWIDNIMAGVILQNVDFDGAGDVGMCPVNNRRIYDNGGLYNVYVIIDGGRFKAAGSPENCIVYCEEVPNLVTVRSATETSGIEIPAVNFRSTVTTQYLQHVSFPELVTRDPELARIYGYMVSMPRIYYVTGYKYENNFSFFINDNNENIKDNVPAVLDQFMESALSESVQAEFVKNAPLKLDEMNSLLTKTINVASFGAEPDGSDCSAEIQAAFDVAADTFVTEVVFPNGIYTLSRPINLPPNIYIRGLGKACFQGDGNLTSLFTGENIVNLSLLNLGFYMAQNAIDISTRANDESRIFVDLCSFADLTGSAVKCLAGNGVSGENNKTRLRITDSVYVEVQQALLSNAADALFDCNWISTRSNGENSAPFVNKGRMKMANVITVPRATFGAWIENYGTLVVDNMRFGAEGSWKNNIVNNKVETGKIFMENSWLNCEKESIVYCDVLPACFALRSNMGIPATGFQKMVTAYAKDKDKLESVFSETANIVPTIIEYLKIGSLLLLL